MVQVCLKLQYTCYTVVLNIVIKIYKSVLFNAFKKVFIKTLAEFEISFKLGL